MSVPRKSLLALVASSLAFAGAGPSSGEAANKSGPQECVSAAISDLQLDKLASVDEIRVRLLPSSPTAASLEVTVETDDSDRIVGMEGDHYKAIQFAPAMIASEYRISLLPSMDGEPPACVQSVELLADGSSVAYFRP